MLFLSTDSSSLMKCQIRPVKRIFGVIFILGVITIAGCNGDGKELSVEEQFLLDVRYDYLRCELYVDRLRDLYDVNDTERDGLMGPDLESGGLLAGAQDAPLNDDLDGPLTGDHDGPLTGDHDGPLTGDHDAPLTGDHDQLMSNLNGVKSARDMCWSAVNRLVTKYNCCVADFTACRDGGATDAACHAEYQVCLTNKRSGLDMCQAGQ